MAPGSIQTDLTDLRVKIVNLQMQVAEMAQLLDLLIARQRTSDASLALLFDQVVARLERIERRLPTADQD